MEADVALPVIDAIKAEVRKDLLGKKVDRRFDVNDAIRLSLKNAVERYSRSTPSTSTITR